MITIGTAVRRGRRIAIAAAAGLTLAGWGVAAFAADCTAAEKTTANQQLTMTAPEAAAAVKRVLPFGVPTTTAPAATDLLVQRDYVIGYDPDLMGPVWSADVLGVKALLGGREDCFRADPRLGAAGPTPADYDEPIFDQGHMVPNGDMTFALPATSPPRVDWVAVHNSFVMTNMSPQFCQFNRGIWQILEAHVRHWSETRGPLYAFNGAVFDRNGDGQRDPDDEAVRMRSRNGASRIAVPTQYYKVLAHPRPDGTLEVLTILFPHTQTDVGVAGAVAYIDAHVSNLAAVEAITGMKFFPDHAGALEELGHPWPTSPGFRFASLTANCASSAGATIKPGTPSVYALP